MFNDFFEKITYLLASLARAVSTYQVDSSSGLRLDNFSVHKTFSSHLTLSFIAVIKDRFKQWVNHLPKDACQKKFDLNVLVIREIVM